MSQQHLLGLLELPDWFLFAGTLVAFIGLLITALVAFKYGSLWLQAKFSSVDVTLVSGQLDDSNGHILRHSIHTQSTLTEPFDCGNSPMRETQILVWIPIAPVNTEFPKACWRVDVHRLQAKLPHVRCDASRK